MAEKAICLQVFNKSDTSVATLDSLAASRGSGDFDLIVVQDGLRGHRFGDRYSAEHADTRRAVETWLKGWSGAFASTRFVPQDLGRGTAGTARATIDLGFEDHDWVVFSEDDVIFEADALEWFNVMIGHDGFLRDDVWAVAGESKHFDSQSRPVAPEKVEEARRLAKEQDLIARYCYAPWLPSSCFATTRARWAEFRETRGMPRGPKLVNDRCAAEGKVSLWPIIARCRDIGMHHPIGYSMTVHKDCQKIPQKSNYISSRDLPRASGEIHLAENYRELFYHYSEV